MSARISSSMVAEYAQVIMDAKDDQEHAADVFTDEAKLEADVAIQCADEAEKTRRTSALIGLGSSGMDVAGSFVKEGSTAAGGLALAGGICSAAQTGLGMLQEGWQTRSSEFAGLSGQAVALAAESNQQADQLNGELATLGASVVSKEG